MLCCVFCAPRASVALRYTGIPDFKTMSWQTLLRVTIPACQAVILFSTPRAVREPSCRCQAIELIETEIRSHSKECWRKINEYFNFVPLTSNDAFEGPSVALSSVSGIDSTEVLSTLNLSIIFQSSLHPLKVLGLVRRKPLNQRLFFIRTVIEPFLLIMQRKKWRIRFAPTKEIANQIWKDV